MVNTKLTNFGTLLAFLWKKKRRNNNAIIIADYSCICFNKYIYGEMGGKERNRLDRAVRTSHEGEPLEHPSSEYTPYNIRRSPDE